VYGIDSLGRDVVQGYGSALIPTVSGQHERLVVLYRPVASSLFQQFLGWISGTLPEVNQGYLHFERLHQALEY
jgi:B9 domain-containing protein 1